MYRESGRPGPGNLTRIMDGGAYGEGDPIIYEGSQCSPIW
jgi:hypothetical protein